MSLLYRRLTQAVLASGLLFVLVYPAFVWSGEQHPIWYYVFLLGLMFVFPLAAGSLRGVGSDRSNYTESLGMGLLGSLLCGWAATAGDSSTWKYAGRPLMAAAGGGIVLGLLVKIELRLLLRFPLIWGFPMAVWAWIWSGSLSTAAILGGRYAFFSFVGGCLGMVIGKQLLPWHNALRAIWTQLRQMGSAILGFALGYFLTVALFALWYAVAWKLDETCLTGFHNPSLWDFGYFSLITMATVGYGDILPVSLPVRALVSLEILAGIGWTLVAFAAVLNVIQSQGRQQRFSRLFAPLEGEYDQILVDGQRLVASATIQHLGEGLLLIKGTTPHNTRWESHIQMSESIPTTGAGTYWQESEEDWGEYMIFIGADGRIRIHNRSAGQPIASHPHCLQKRTTKRNSNAACNSEERIVPR